MLKNLSPDLAVCERSWNPLKPGMKYEAELFNWPTTRPKTSIVAHSPTE
jgi:hypothetical protein